MPPRAEGVSCAASAHLAPPLVTIAQLLLEGRAGAVLQHEGYWLGQPAESLQRLFQPGRLRGDPSGAHARLGPELRLAALGYSVLLSATPWQLDFGQQNSSRLL